MSGFIKVKAKELLLKNTIKLFFVSFVSFLLRALFLISVILLTHFSLVSNTLQSLVHSYNSLIVYFFYSLIIVIAYLLLFLFISGIKLGENAIYYMQSKGGNAKFKYLFIFLRPSQSFRALYLNLKTTFLKSCWFIFFFLPPLMCLILTGYVFYNSFLYTAVFYTLIFGTIALFSISRFFYNCAVIRYSFSSYYLCTDLEISVNDAIHKSTERTDTFIKDGVLLKASFLPWILSCVFVFPLFYVVPFVKLSKAKYVTFSDALRKTLPQNAEMPLSYEPET
jgi:hypothetical protein